MHSLMSKIEKKKQKQNKNKNKTRKKQIQKQNQRRTAKKSCIHCLQNGSSVTISCYIFEWGLKISKFLCKHGFIPWIELKLLGTISSCCVCLAGRVLLLENATTQTHQKPIHNDPEPPR